MLRILHHVSNCTYNLKYTAMEESQKITDNKVLSFVITNQVYNQILKNLSTDCKALTQKINIIQQHKTTLSYAMIIDAICFDEKNILQQLFLNVVLFLQSFSETDSVTKAIKVVLQNPNTQLERLIKHKKKFIIDIEKLQHKDMPLFFKELSKYNSLSLNLFSDQQKQEGPTNVFEKLFNDYRFWSLLKLFDIHIKNKEVSPQLLAQTTQVLQLFQMLLNVMQFEIVIPECLNYFYKNPVIDFQILSSSNEIQKLENLFNEFLEIKINDFSNNIKEFTNIIQLHNKRIQKNYQGSFSSVVQLSEFKTDVLRNLSFEESISFAAQLFQSMIAIQKNKFWKAINQLNLIDLAENSIGSGILEILFMLKQNCNSILFQLSPQDNNSNFANFITQLIFFQQFPYNYAKNTKELLWSGSTDFISVVSCLHNSYREKQDHKEPQDNHWSNAIDVLYKIYNCQDIKLEKGTEKEVLCVANIMIDLALNTLPKVIKKVFKKLSYAQKFYQNGSKELLSSNILFQEFLQLHSSNHFDWQVTSTILLKVISSLLSLNEAPLSLEQTELDILGFTTAFNSKDVKKTEISKLNALFITQINGFKQELKIKIKDFYQKHNLRTKEELAAFSLEQLSNETYMKPIIIQLNPVIDLSMNEPIVEDQLINKAQQYMTKIPLLSFICLEIYLKTLNNDIAIYLQKKLFNTLLVKIDLENQLKKNKADRKFNLLLNHLMSYDGNELLQIFDKKRKQDGKNVNKLIGFSKILTSRNMFISPVNQHLQQITVPLGQSTLLSLKNEYTMLYKGLMKAGKFEIRQFTTLPLNIVEKQVQFKQSLPTKLYIGQNYLAIEDSKDNNEQLVFYDPCTIISKEPDTIQTLNQAINFLHHNLQVIEEINEIQNQTITFSTEDKESIKK